MSKLLIANAVFAGLVSVACAFSLDDFNAHRRRPDVSAGKKTLRNAGVELERSLENIARVGNIEFTQRGIDILKYEIAQDIDEFFEQFENANPTTRTETKVPDYTKLGDDIIKQLNNVVQSRSIVGVSGLTTATEKLRNAFTNLNKTMVDSFKKTDNTVTNPTDPTNAKVEMLNAIDAIIKDRPLTNVLNAVVQVTGVIELEPKYEDNTMTRYGHVTEIAEDSPVVCVEGCMSFSFNRGTLGRIRCERTRRVFSVLRRTVTDDFECMMMDGTANEDVTKTGVTKTGVNAAGPLVLMNDDIKLTCPNDDLRRCK